MYVRLKELVGKQFTVRQVTGFNYQKWDNENRKMLKSDTWVEGYRKTYEVDVRALSDNKILSLSASQLGQLHEKVSKYGKSDLIDKTFEVGSNGKTGMEIRYWFKAIWEKKETLSQPTPEANKEIDATELNF